MGFTERRRGGGSRRSRWWARPDLRAAQRGAEDARRRHEAAIEECRGFLARAQAVTSVGVWRSGIGDGAEVRWSPETYRILGVDATTHPMLRVADLLSAVHPDDDALVREARALVPVDGRPRTIEYRIRRADGAERWLQELIEVVRDSRGAPAELAGVVRDVTDQRRAVEQLRHSHRMEIVGQFAGTIAHDVNNLSTVIIGYAHLAANEIPVRENPAEDLAQIRRAADAIAALTRQLLAFSRRQLLEPKLFDVDDTIRALEPAVRSLVGPGVRLELQCRASSATVRADESQLEQVVLNLALNARDATASGDTITLETAVTEVPGRSCADGQTLDAGTYVALRVADTGFGMDEVTRRRCFEPFFTTKPVGRGTGLGLATVAGVAHQYGGAVDVESTPGLGSTFTVWLPCAPLGAHAARRTGGAGIESRRSRAADASRGAAPRAGERRVRGS